MGFSHHRRFLTRVGDDNHPLQSLEGGGEQHDEIPTLSARIEEKQKSHSRPYQNNKIYPNSDELFPGEAEERQRQSHLQKKICIFLCTVLPLVTTGATIHRLWFTGLLSFKGRTDDQDCPQGWTAWSGSCYRHINTSHTWPAALATCGALGSNLADIDSRSENLFLTNLIDTDSWTGGLLEIESDTWHWEGGASWTWSGWGGAVKGRTRYGCLKLLRGGNWSSEDCSSEQSVLCEVGADILPAPAEAMVSDGGTVTRDTWNSDDHMPDLRPCDR